MKREKSILGDKRHAVNVLVLKLKDKRAMKSRDSDVLNGLKVLSSGYDFFKSKWESPELLSNIRAKYDVSCRFML